MRVFCDGGSFENGRLCLGGNPGMLTETAVLTIRQGKGGRAPLIFRATKTSFQQAHNILASLS